MNYEIVKIAREADREVAYLFDRGAGKLIKMLVEDYTGSLVPPAQPERIRVRPVPIPTRDDPHFIEVPQKFQPTPAQAASSTFVPKGFKAVESTKSDLPDKPPPASPPAHLAGVFGGTAEERRIA